MLNRLDTRIAALFLALLLAVQLAGFGLIREVISLNARATIGEELENGARLIRRLLDQHNQRMVESARVLAADFGFRSAIASGDRATLADTLNTDRDRARVEARLRGETQSIFSGLAMVAAAEVDELRRNPGAAEFAERWAASGGERLDALVQDIVEQVLAGREAATRRVLGRAAARLGAGDGGGGERGRVRAA